MANSRQPLSPMKNLRSDARSFLSRICRVKISPKFSSMMINVPITLAIPFADCGHHDVENPSVVFLGLYLGEQPRP